MPRFLLALLIVCLALPAVAVEACAPPPGEPALAMHGHHTPPTSDDQEQAPGAGTQHGCIGGVPPLAASAMPEATPFLAGPFASEPLALDLAPPFGPAPPPPASPPERAARRCALPLQTGHGI